MDRDVSVVPWTRPVGRWRFGTAHDVHLLPDTPAAKAGLQAAEIDPDGGLDPGDVIIGLDGDRIATTEAFRAALDLHQAGDAVTLNIRRDGKLIDFEMVLEPGS